MDSNTVSTKSTIRQLRAAILAILMILSTITLFSVDAYAEDNRSAKTVRVPMDDSNLFIVKDSTGKPIGGYGYEYIQYIAVYAGWKVEYVPCGGFVDCVQAVLDGNADFLYDVSYTEDREELFLYPDTPMGSEVYYLYCLNGNMDIHSGDYSSYNGKTVGVTKGTTQIDILKQWCEDNSVNLNFREYVSIPDKEAALESGEIDLDYEISMLAKSNYSALTKIASDDYYLVINKKRTDLLEDLNTACRKIEEVNPFFTTNLNQKYFAKSILNRTLSKDELEWVNNHSVLKVGYMEDYLPFSSQNSDGKPDGIVKDVMPVLLRNIGLEALQAEYTAYVDNTAMYAALKSGEIDVAFPVYDNIEFSVENDISITASVISLTADLVCLENEINNESSSIAVNSNNKLQECYTKACYPDSELVYFDTIEAALTAVSKGRVGSTILNGLRTEALLSDDAYENLTTVVLPTPFNISFAVDQGNSSLLSILNRTILSMEDGFALNYAFQYIDSQEDDSLTGFVQSNKKLLMRIAFFALLIVVAIAVVAAVTFAKSKKKLAEANDAKTHFLFNMSHDIRTPLNAILGFTDMAEKSSGDPEKVSDYHNKIKESGNLLLSLINSVLEMSRIESGRTDLNESPRDISCSFDAINSTMLELAKKKNIDLSFEFGNIQDKYIFVDPERANRIFINIISNAIKYTNYGGRIRVKCEQVGRQDDEHGLYRYTFEDNGIGMSDEFQKHIFDEFSRENTTTTSGVQGTGLGLSVTKAFVDLMNGTIECKSKQGEGTTFTVTFPFRLQKTDNNAPYIATLSGDGEAVDLNPERKDGAQSILAGKMVLLVEDNELNREIARFILEEENMIVEEADDGSTAVNMLKEKGPKYYNIILMDIQMPIMDGIEATKVIREMYPDANIPIIALSANAFAEDKAKSFAAGINDHISKPINTTELFGAMKKLL